MRRQNNPDSSSLPSVSPLAIAVVLLIAGVILAIVLVNERHFAAFWTGLNSVWTVLLQVLGSILAGTAVVTLLLQRDVELRDFMRWLLCLLAGCSCSTRTGG